nr:hypothetical protein [Staphylococcus aureus]
MNHSNVDVVADLLLEKSKRDMAESYHHYDVRPMSDATVCLNQFSDLLSQSLVTDLNSSPTSNCSTTNRMAK